jgi:putative transposase
LLDVIQAAQPHLFEHPPTELRKHSRAGGPIHLEAPKSRVHNHAMLYRGFASKLHHQVPHWVEPGALFHIRIALDRQRKQRPLTELRLAQGILDSANFYQTKQRWHIGLFLVMPDHVHALLSFARDHSMSRIVGDWKHFHSRTNAVLWQEGYFDHRLRNDERGEQLSAKLNYIRQNPVASGLCLSAKEWPWIIDPCR